MPGFKPTDPSVKAEILHQIRNQGMSVSEAAASHRVSPKTIYTWLRAGVVDIFKNDIEGEVIDEVRGKSDKSPNTTVTVLDSDNGKTIAEVFEQGADAVIARYKNRPDAWHGFVEWYKKIQ